MDNLPITSGLERSLFVATVAKLAFGSFLSNVKVNFGIISLSAGVNEPQTLQTLPFLGFGNLAKPALTGL